MAVVKYLNRRRMAMAVAVAAAAADGLGELAENNVEF